MSERHFIEEVESSFSMREKDTGHEHETMTGFDSPLIIHVGDKKIGCMSLDWNPHLIPNYVSLAYLFIYQPQQGIGTIVLNKVCELADKHGVTLFLDAVPQKPNSRSIENFKLKQWYKSFGFIHSDVRGSNNMERKPGA